MGAAHPGSHLTSARIQRVAEQRETCMSPAALIFTVGVGPNFGQPLLLIKNDGNEDLKI